MTASGDDEHNGAQEREVLSSLPRTRPQRRSSKRPGRGRAAPKRASASSAPRASTPKRTAKPQSRATSAKPGAKPTAVRPSAATSHARRPRSASARQTPPPRRAAQSPTGSELVETAIEAAAELAQLGLSVGARAVRGAISRIPRP
jgi:hypothetical protein